MLWLVLTLIASCGAVGLEAEENTPNGPLSSLGPVFWTQRHQELAARDWRDDLASEATEEDLILNEEESVPMSPAWLRKTGDLVAVRESSAELEHIQQDLKQDRDRLQRREWNVDNENEGRLDRVRRALKYFRRKRSPLPDPSEASSEDVATPTGTERKLPPPPPQVKAARSHQFITARNEKQPPPVLREVQETSAADKPGHQEHSGISTPSVPPPLPHGVSTSRFGAARDALGVRTNEIPQGPRFSSVYESDTVRHANDHRMYASDSYGSHNGYSAQYGGNFGSGGYPAGGYNNPYPSPSSSSAVPRRIIYYASLPDPVPYPPPGASRTPHEYRGPPFEVNGALADARYPYDARSQNDYRPRFRPGSTPPVPRYTIIDAEPPSPSYSGYRAPLSPAPSSPYRERERERGSIPHPYRLAGVNQDVGPQSAAPIQYTQYDYNGIAGLPPHLPTDPMSESGARTANSAALLDTPKAAGNAVPAILSKDPYRGFNPRQPAPWSMQVGTQLTVKDDGYGGIGGLSPAGRRFYVTSQQQTGANDFSGFGGGSFNPRIPRPLDRSEARNHLLR